MDLLLDVHRYGNTDTVLREELHLFPFHIEDRLTAKVFPFSLPYLGDYEGEQFS